MNSLLICRTCPRDAQESGLPGAELAARLSDIIECHGVQLLRVSCLGACRQPCAVALDAPRKQRLRFSRLDSSDACDLEVVIQRYCLSEDGCLPPHMLPLALRDRLSAISPKLTQVS
ncbi:MAG: DUF1636 family protein [Gammaproteobacteria bacterium]